MTTQQVDSEDEVEYTGEEMTLTEHLAELRSRLIKCVIGVVIGMVISFGFIQQIMEILLRLVPPKYHTIAITPLEKFGAYMKVAFLCGIVLAMPLLVYQAIAFISPGLTRRERRYVFRALPAVTGLFMMGIAFGYFVVMPRALNWLFGFGTAQIEVTPRISNFISFVVNFLLAIGISFLTPFFVYILIKLNVVSVRKFTSIRRYVFIGILVIAAIITPTWDPVNLMIVAIPMYLLFELGILLGRIA